MNSEQLLIGVSLTLVLAVGSQVLAGRLRLPALIVLLPVGFTAGAVTDLVNARDLLGTLFEPVVSFSVAVILFDACLGLDVRRLRGSLRRVVVTLVAFGVPATWALAALRRGVAPRDVPAGRGHDGRDPGRIRSYGGRPSPGVRAAGGASWRRYSTGKAP